MITIVGFIGRGNRVIHPQEDVEQLDERALRIAASVKLVPLPTATLVLVEDPRWCLCVLVDSLASVQEWPHVMIEN